MTEKEVQYFFSILKIANLKKQEIIVTSFLILKVTNNRLIAMVISKRDN